MVIPVTGCVTVNSRKGMLAHRPAQLFQVFLELAISSKFSYETAIWRIPEERGMLWFCTILLGTVAALDNGLARTPPMGWMSWTAFYCEMDCVKHPKSCINENLYMEMANALVVGGYRDAGYVSVHVDDCWMGRQRDRATGKLTADPIRFPSGMHNLARYMHARGLKFGIYEDFGTKTCAGFPGSLGHLQSNQKWFILLEYELHNGYAAMERALNATGRPIVYSCSWPAYMIDQPQKVDYNQIAKSCNLWRNFDDINSSWKSILSIIDYYDHNQDKHIPTHGPGHWHDPDMVSGVSAYVKPITPVYGSDTSFAIAVLNRNNRANDVEFKLRNLGLTNDRGYILKDLWSNAPMVNASPDDMVRFRVPATVVGGYRDAGYVSVHVDDCWMGRERDRATGRLIADPSRFPSGMRNLARYVDYNQIGNSCNLWRNYRDIRSSWESILRIIDYYGRNQDKLIPTHGPGHWHDPDMLVIGNPGITVNMAIAQMTICLLHGTLSRVFL
ncbi:alpha-galactosidase [Teladorsagia circumcincta]|uniref:Alpha-galactosidase n=1 Tax=Teladorsagia circumcincta TaxID=45464 RepID=A0A2G9UT24_TELCI|nr:alpha-galactosidase [Teladorsagia circumcincta]